MTETLQFNGFLLPVQLVEVDYHTKIMKWHPEDTRLAEDAND